MIPYFLVVRTFPYFSGLETEAKGLDTKLMCKLLLMSVSPGILEISWSLFYLTDEVAGKMRENIGKQGRLNNIGLCKEHRAM